MNEWKCVDFKCVRKPIKSRLSLTHHGNKSTEYVQERPSHHNFIAKVKLAIVKRQYGYLTLDSTISYMYLVLLVKCVNPWNHSCWTHFVPHIRKKQSFFHKKVCSRVHYQARGQMASPHVPSVLTSNASKLLRRRVITAAAHLYGTMLALPGINILCSISDFTWLWPKLQFVK